MKGVMSEKYPQKNKLFNNLTTNKKKRKLYIIYEVERQVKEIAEQ